MNSFGGFVLSVMEFCGSWSVVYCDFWSRCVLISSMLIADLSSIWGIGDDDVLSGFSVAGCCCC